MASQPNPLPADVGDKDQDEKALTYDQWWDVVEGLFGSAKEAYAEVGGSDAFMRAEREAWDEDYPH